MLELQLKELLNFSWCFIILIGRNERYEKMSQYKTRSQRHIVKKQRRQKVLKNTLPLMGTALVVSPMLMTVGSIKADAAATQSSASFVAQLGASATTISAQNDLYASIMVAQALLETGYGSSSLSQAPYYNLFGIKEYGSGPSVTMSTQEYLNGQWVTMNEPFAVYNSYAESFQAHASLMTSSYYAGARKSHTYSYQDAATYLQGRYATDPSYASKLISLIQTYNLTQYDTGGSVATTTTAATTTAATTASTATSSQTTAAATTSGQSYTIQSGDSIWGIAERYGLSVNEFMSINGLTSSSTIVPGQTVTI